MGTVEGMVMAEDINTMLAAHTGTLNSMKWNQNSTSRNFSS